MKTNRYKDLSKSAIFVCVFIICALISIPIGAIPITLQTFGITLAAYMCSPKQSAISIWTYLLLGAVGCPIFASMHGGLGSLLGPSGGFLWGYALFLPLASFAAQKIKTREMNEYRKLALLILVGILLTLFAYTAGTLQYMIVANIDLVIALLTAVVPFIVFDLIKIVLALLISIQLEKVI